MGTKKSFWSGMNIFSGTKNNNLHEDTQMNEDAMEAFQKAKEAKEREYFERQKQREEEITRVENEKRIQKIKRIEEAKESWKSELDSQLGQMYLERITNNWKRYTLLYKELKSLENMDACQFKIIEFLLTDIEQLKEHKDIMTVMEGANFSRMYTAAALDQLLLRRMIVIAVEGSLDYYRINLKWNILLEIEKLEQQISEYEQQRQGVVYEEVLTNSVLQPITIEPMDGDEVAKRLSSYEQMIEKEILDCLRKWNRPMTMYDLTTYSGQSEISRISQLKLEETLRKLANRGTIERVVGDYSIKYILKE